MEEEAHQLISLLVNYRSMLGRSCAQPLTKTAHLGLLQRKPETSQEKLDLALDMVNEMLEAIPETGVTDKMNRWLGFLQGIVWCEQLRTINEMRDENRPIFSR